VSGLESCRHIPCSPKHTSSLPSNPTDPHIAVPRPLFYPSPSPDILLRFVEGRWLPPSAAKSRCGPRPVSLSLKFSSLSQIGSSLVLFCFPTHELPSSSPLPISPSSSLSHRFTPSPSPPSLFSSSNTFNHQTQIIESPLFLCADLIPIISSLSPVRHPNNSFADSLALRASIFRPFSAGTLGKVSLGRSRRFPFPLALAIDG
jgi:hypothetical protein